MGAAGNGWWWQIKVDDGKGGWQTGADCGGR